MEEYYPNSVNAVMFSEEKDGGGRKWGVRDLWADVGNLSLVNSAQCETRWTCVLMKCGNALSNLRQGVQTLTSLARISHESGRLSRSSFVFSVVTVK